MAIVEILDEIDGVKYPPIDLKQSDLFNITWKEFDLISVNKKKQKENEEEQEESSVIAGIFRIRINPNETLEKAKSGIIQVFYTPKARDIRVTYSSGEILYIGKTHDIRKRVRKIFSRNGGSNLVARKIAAIFKESKQNSKNDITIETLNDIKKRVVLDYMEVTHPIIREFLKSYAVSIDRPCLNTGLEH